MEAHSDALRLATSAHMCNDESAGCNTRIKIKVPPVDNASNPLVRLIQLNIFDDPGLRPWDRSRANNQSLGLDLKDASALRSTCRDLSDQFAEPKSLQYDRLCRKSLGRRKAIGPMPEENARIGFEALQYLDEHVGVAPFVLAKALSEFEQGATDDASVSTPNARKGALHLMMVTQSDGQTGLDAAENFGIIETIRDKPEVNLAQYCLGMHPEIVTDGLLAAATSASAGISLVLLARSVQESTGHMLALSNIVPLLGATYLTGISLSVCIPVSIGFMANMLAVRKETNAMMRNPMLEKDAMIYHAINTNVLPRLRHADITLGAATYRGVPSEVLGKAIILAYLTMVKQRGLNLVRGET